MHLSSSLSLSFLIKILFAAIATLGTAQLMSAQSVTFDRLYGNGDPNNYYIGHYPVTGSDGLDIHWYGGLRLGTSAGTALQIYNTNVGIGTENPKAKLDVTFPGEPKNILFMDAPNGNEIYTMISKMRFSWYNNTADFGMVRSGSTPIEALAINFNDQEKVRFSSNGNLGIGTKDPQAKLDVRNGSISVGNDNLQGGEIYFGNTNHGIVRQENTIRLFTAGGSESSLSFGHKDPTTGNYSEHFKIAYDGNASLQGKFEARELKVTTTPTADFVFERDYQLPSLDVTEKYIAENHHLPEIPSAGEMDKSGVNIGKFQISLLRKIEELTLYSIEQNKKIKELTRRVELLTLHK